jgi:inner membrane protein
MTGRTHDLAAFTALTYVIVYQSLTPMSLVTAFVAFSVNMIGGLAPDIDQPTAQLWHDIRGGSIIGKIVQPLLGGHRYISHSIIGLGLFGLLVGFVLGEIKTVVLVDLNINIIWWSFMIGYISHLIMDSFTQEGVPWLFPIPIRFGIPPFRILRFKTGGIVEKSFVFPMLLITNIYLFYTHYHKFLDFFKNYLK